MANAPTGPAQYVARFGEQSIACSQYALAKLGVDRSHCSLKIDDYVILCVPFQLGFKRSLFLASLSKQELTFFQRYLNGIVGLSIAFNPDGRAEPLKFFIRCTLSTVGQMKNRENVGLLVVDFKSTPDEMVVILGSFLEQQERLRFQYEDYSKTMIHVTPETSKILGYNMYATIMEPGTASRRIQVVNLSSKVVEHLEASGAPIRKTEAGVAYQFFFQKYRISAAGIIETAVQLPQGIVRTVSGLSYSPELVEIIDDYWLNTRSTPVQAQK
ncbi:MAG: hypothetical protein LBI67_05635 [Treponema sp.]|jgi:hypothetical protein|nr:hypothetical protein [Treponema sp.]